MVSADTNIWIAHLAGEQADDVETLAIALRFQRAMMPPPVLSELLSDPDMPGGHRSDLQSVPRLELGPGFWERAGLLRASLWRMGLRPKLADTLIVQCCLDYQVPLLTRDKGFAMFAKHSGLKLAK
ncbi:MAG: PIN domain-containing protein [Acidobacteria bacterium]|nr:PIN domain-containing protein [Acidobacteriota bacterium]